VLKGGLWFGARADGSGSNLTHIRVRTRLQRSGRCLPIEGRGIRDPRLNGAGQVEGRSELNPEFNWQAAGLTKDPELPRKTPNTRAQSPAGRNGNFFASVPATLIMLSLN